MRYEGNIFRPPSEANSLLIQATIGCPHNKCAFCAMYKGEKFRMRDVEDVKEDIAAAYDYYGDGMIRTMFLPDANSIILKTDKLAEICRFARKTFSRLERITVYGGAKFVIRKSLEELKLLHEAGLSRIHMGMESGDDVTLKRMKKGVNAETIIEAGKRVVESGIELSEYYMVGLGGVERSEEHARESARVLSAINPKFIRMRTTVPIPDTELFQDFQDKKWEMPSPHQALREIKLLIENLDCESEIHSDHNSNFWDINGKLPHDKDAMLKELEAALKVDEASFRPYWSVNL
jgi:radical SAM superfamily enzyme YgiQ (UPF0313 family)